MAKFLRRVVRQEGAAVGEDHFAGGLYRVCAVADLDRPLRPRLPALAGDVECQNHGLVNILVVRPLRVVGDAPAEREGEGALARAGAEYEVRGDVGVLLAGVEYGIGHCVEHRVWRKLKKAGLLVGDEFRHERRVELRPAAFPARVDDKTLVAFSASEPVAIFDQQPRGPGGV